MNPEKFADRLKKLNKYLLYFPTREGQNSTQLAEDELINIMDNAKKVYWHITMLSQGRRPDTFETLEEAEECYKQLYQADQMRKTLTKAQNKGNTGEKKRKRDHNGHGRNADKFKNSSIVLKVSGRLPCDNIIICQSNFFALSIMSMSSSSANCVEFWPSLVGKYSKYLFNFLSLSANFSGFMSPI